MVSSINYLSSFLKIKILNHFFFGLLRHSIFSSVLQKHRWPPFLVRVMTQICHSCYCKLIKLIYSYIVESFFVKNKIDKNSCRAV